MHGTRRIFIYLFSFFKTRNFQKRQLSFGRDKWKQKNAIVLSNEWKYLDGKLIKEIKAIIT